MGDGIVTVSKENFILGLLPFCLLLSFSALRMKDTLWQLLIFFFLFGKMFMIGIRFLKLKPPFVEFFIF